MKEPAEKAGFFHALMLARAAPVHGVPRPPQYLRLRTRQLPPAFTDACHGLSTGVLKARIRKYRTLAVNRNRICAWSAGSRNSGCQQHGSVVKSGRTGTGTEPVRPERSGSHPEDRTGPYFHNRGVFRWN